MSEFSINPMRSTVLVADDNKILLRLMVRQLEAFGFSVTTVADGQEALEVFRLDPHGFDLILTDHDMPGLDGRSLAWQIKDIRPNLPVMLLTGNPNNGHQALPPEGPFSSVLYKPFTKSELRHSMQSALKKTGASVA